MATPLLLKRWPIFGWSVLKALLPFPTPSVLALAGAAVVPPDTRLAPLLTRLLWRLALPGAAGMTLGSVPYYAWARWKGRDALERFLARREKWRSMAERMERGIARHPASAIVVMRALPVVPLALGSLLIGLSECSWMDFAVWTFCGTFARAGALALSGHFARAAIFWTWR